MKHYRNIRQYLNEAKIGSITLLGVDTNPKTVKGQKKGFMTAIMYLAPWKLAGINLCPMAHIADCGHGCLNTAGRGGMAKADADVVEVEPGHVVKMNQVQKARIARTRFYAEDREGFMNQLAAEISAFLKKAERANLTPTVRLNGTSDIAWEKIPVHGAKNIFELFPNVQFYDYTKIPNRRNLPPNYHLTYSFSGVDAFQPYVKKAIDTMPGVNLAVVFRKELPTHYMGRQVVSGDETDLRFLDPKGVIVGLKAKGKARKDTSGFVIDPSEANSLSKIPVRVVHK